MSKRTVYCRLWISSYTPLIYPPYITPLHKQITPAKLIASVTALLLSDSAACETDAMSPPIIANIIDSRISMQNTHFIMIMTTPFREIALYKSICVCGVFMSLTFFRLCDMIERDKVRSVMMSNKVYEFTATIHANPEKISEQILRLNPAAEQKKMLKFIKG